MSDVKLLPCPNPWCTVASDPRLSGFRYYGKDTFEVACRCGISGPVCGSEAEAIATWNTRRAPALTPKQEPAEELYDALKAAYHHIGNAAITFDEWESVRNVIRAAITKAGQP